MECRCILDGRRGELDAVAGQAGAAATLKVCAGQLSPEPPEASRLVEKPPAPLPEAALAHSSVFS